jgi:hypothetical protein
LPVATRWLNQWVRAPHRRREQNVPSEWLRFCSDQYPGESVRPLRR